jgi:PAS domain S-box-containing protein
MNGLSYFLNPIARLGNRHYSFWTPFLITLFIIFISEVYAYGIAKDPMAVGVYAIFLFVALIIYFSFRDGILGGLIASGLTIGYYFYIIYTRQYSGEMLASGIQTTLFLGVVYSLLSGVIGWLKQTIDSLIEREANEKRRLETIIAQLPVGIIITDSKGVVVEVNKKVDAIMGMKLPIGFKMGQAPLLDTRQNGKKLSPSQGPFAQVIATGKPVIGKEMIITRKDGKQVYIQTSASPIHTIDGKMIAAASIITDVTQQRELEQRKDDFVNMASHELKTPITSMKLYIETLMARLDTKDERVLKILSRIKYQTENLQELVSDLLDVSRIQTGKLTFHKETFSLTELIDESVHVMQETTLSHKITFNKKHKIAVQADKFRIYQVLTNLLTNAIKYSPEGGEVIIAVRKDAGKVTVSVSDSGIGITKEQQKKIFDRLYQVTDPKEKTFPGLGMGLFISKEIIKRHKGNLWVESQKDKGSTFYFSLPGK